MNDKYGWDNFFKKFAANNPKIGRSVFDATTDIVSGERVVGPGADSLALERKAGGNSINIAFPEDDTILVTAPVTVMKEAPHPNAARLLMNFYYSQRILADDGDRRSTCRCGSTCPPRDNIH